MIREMTLGQYYKADSILHRLDPRVKLAGTVLFVISLFFPKNLLGVLVASIFLFTVVKLSKVPWKMMIRGIKPLLFVVLFSAIVNLFGMKGTVLIQFGRFHITVEGIWMALFLIFRLVYLVMGTSIMTFTTTPNQLTDGLEKALGFLNVIHIPVHEIAMMMSIALRFIPILTEELDKIMKAQMSRGAAFDEGNLLQKAKQIVPILVPLFVSAIRRASELALAMDARCYIGGSGRTKMHPLIYQKRDYLAYLTMLIYLAVMIFISFVLKIGAI
ncbi:MAG: energy-coupling factor transporter transmembrane component T [Eubacteriales bacterium]|nr:energy-coupling factor transporter transmembrane component T [Eubacteriales bacterium]